MKKILPLVFCLFLFLTGCVRYEVGINFQDQHHGAITQHITLAEQLTTLSQKDAQKWLDSFETRAQKMQGKTERISEREILVTIPFSNGQELATKFNDFFNYTNSQTSQTAKIDSTELLQLNSELSIKQSNALLFERNKLTLDLDLRPLGVLSNQGKIIVSPGSLINLEFILNTPWLGYSVAAENVITPEIIKEKNQLVWQLQPGQINHIEAIFWLPSPLGIGTAIIILLMIAGFYLKYKHFPGISSINFRNSPEKLAKNT